MTGLADPADLAEVERIVRAAGTSFYRGMRILPPDRRSAMYGIYAFCRLVDDVADEPAPLEDKRRQLAEWRARIRDLSQDRATCATTRVLLAATRRYALREADFLAVIDGMETDAETTVIAPPLSAFDLYCDQVASAVGRLSVRAFGDASAAADEVAWHLGRALQMVNVLRDLGEDAARGRLYLPREWLDEAGIPHDPQKALRHPRLPEACRHGSARAHAHFAQARDAMARCDRRAMRPARLMALSYSAVLDEMDRRGWRNPAVRVELPKWRKLIVAASVPLLR